MISTIQQDESDRLSGQCADTLGRALVVLGMHRSGTSALAGTLSFLGANPGSRLEPAVEGINPKGFWEHSDIVALHDRFLGTLNSWWDDERPFPEAGFSGIEPIEFQKDLAYILRRDFSDTPLWLVKDPRICRWLPLWINVLRGMSEKTLFVLSLRHPCEVAKSLLTRDAIPVERGHLIWSAYQLDAERHSRGQQRVIIPFKNLITDWRAVADTVGNAIGGWPIPTAQAAADIDGFIDRNLRHHVHDDLVPDHPACQLAKRVYDCLVSDQIDEALLDKLHTEYLELSRLLAPWMNQLQICQAGCRAMSLDLSRLDAELAVASKEISRVKRSVSWRITAPLRVLWNLFRRPFRKT